MLRQPAVYINHGGGPMPLLGQQPSVAEFLSAYASKLSARPMAVVIVSAHWEADVPTVTSGELHPLLFDYHGFPPETYRYTYDAPGSPNLAERICGLFQSAGIKHARDSQRGWDHGVFIPLQLMFPSADVPVVQLSLTSDQEAQRLLDIGAALAPLRDEGVLIIGSGVSFHNFGYLFARDAATRSAGFAHSRAFDEWLSRVLTDSTLQPSERIAALAEWASRAPSAREAHPKGAAEHLLPLHVVAGAAGGAAATKVGREAGPDELTAGFAMSSFEFR